MLTIVTWFWGTKYDAAHIDRLRNSLARNVRQPYRFLIETPDPVDDPLLAGCLVRLRMFEPQWQADHDIRDRLVSIDLGVVITGALDPLFDRPEPFVILQGGNASNPCPYNCGLMMLRPGIHADIWQTFTPQAAAKVPYYAFPDDQSWIYHKVPDAAGWHVGPQSGVWSFKKRNWPPGDDLPEGARLVVFPGSRKPAQFTHLPWIKQNWQ